MEVADITDSLLRFPIVFNFRDLIILEFLPVVVIWWYEGS